MLPRVLGGESQPAAGDRAAAIRPARPRGGGREEEDGVTSSRRQRGELGRRNGLGRDGAEGGAGLGRASWAAGSEREGWAAGRLEGKERMRLRVGGRDADFGDGPRGWLG